MNAIHKIRFIIWSLVAAMAMTNGRLQDEYRNYKMMCWDKNAAAMDTKEWLHRRWFPKYYRSRENNDWDNVLRALNALYEQWAIDKSDCQNALDNLMRAYDRWLD